MLFTFSDGVPRVINILCHKSMLVAYGQGKKHVEASSMERALKDSMHLLVKPVKGKSSPWPAVKNKKASPWLGVFSGLGVVFIGAVAFVLVRHFGLIH